MESKKRKLRARRKVRVRKKIFGTADKPRLSVYKSLRYVYAQLIDDVSGKTLLAASSLKTDHKSGNAKAAEEVGALIAEKAKSQKINEVVFDRNGFIYHGVVKTLADSARNAGLKF